MEKLRCSSALCPKAANCASSSARSGILKLCRRTEYMARVAKRLKEKGERELPAIYRSLDRVGTLHVEDLKDLNSQSTDTPYSSLRTVYGVLRSTMCIALHLPLTWFLSVIGPLVLDLRWRVTSSPEQARNRMLCYSLFFGLISVAFASRYYGPIRAWPSERPAYEMLASHILCKYPYSATLCMLNIFSRGK